jgi:hypothetical protein
VSRFAPITSSLLARKGDAMPSAAVANAVKPSLFWSRETPPAPPPLAEPPHPAPLPPSPEGPAKPHRMVVMLTPNEFERLGIAAVKKNLTRHQIVRAALDTHLDRLKREYGGCGCMANGGSCSNGCGAA